MMSTVYCRHEPREYMQQPIGPVTVSRHASIFFILVVNVISFAISDPLDCPRSSTISNRSHCHALVGVQV